MAKLKPKAKSKRTIQCFVIMPYGNDKTDTDGSLIDFDNIYKTFIKRTVHRVVLPNHRINCIRCDEDLGSGEIFKKMMEYIYDSEVAIVDITSLNANVFYELGVRHALAKNVTVLIRRQGTKPPFNIQNMSVLVYSKDENKRKDDAKKLTEAIRAGLRSIKVDSQVRNALPLWVAHAGDELHPPETHFYRLRKVPKKRIGLIVDGLQNLRGIDVWVNSENTDMEMSQPQDKSVSGLIRNLSAERDPVTNKVTKDVIYDELRRIGEQPAGAVVATSPGALKGFGVKKVFHAAAVTGQIGKGFKAIADVGACVTNALHLTGAPEHQELGIKSIIFPLLATGTARAEPEIIVESLFRAAIKYLEKNPDSTVHTVYFVMLSITRLRICERVLDHMDGVVRVRGR